MTAPVLTTLVASYADLSLVQVVLLSATVSLIALYIVILASETLIHFVRGDRNVGGKYFGKDVYRTAMEDLHERKRKGGLMDAESNRALREYSGEGGGRSRRSKW